MPSNILIYSNNITATESYTPEYKNITIRRVFDKEKFNNLNAVLSSSMITKDRGNTINTNSGTYLEDRRLGSIYNNFNRNIQIYNSRANIKMKLNTDDDGIFFSYISDAFSNKYVISNGIQNYENKSILTNITRYSSIKYDGINSYLVNYIGIPFF